MSSPVIHNPELPANSQTLSEFLDADAGAQMVHVTLRPEVCQSPEDLRATLALLEDRAGLVSSNPRRAQRYGIVSGQVEVRRISQLEDVPGVQSVTVDGLKHAL